MASWSIISSRVIASPGSRLVPQRKPGEKAICAPCTSISASQISWSQLPLKLPRRYSSAVGDGELLGQLALVRRAHLRDQRVHLRVGLEQVGEHRQQRVAEVGHLAVLHVEVDHAEELAVAAGVGDERRAAGVLHQHRHRHAVVRVAAEDGVDAAHARGHLQVDVHAVVRQHHDHLRALAARFVDHLLHVLVLDAEAPVGHHVARVGDRRVGEGLADDGHRHAVDRAIT